jgi:hypothetical protein
MTNFLFYFPVIGLRFFAFASEEATDTELATRS